MSIARPQNRDEFRQYILTKLGAPVLEVNVAQEQIDIAIEDAFQYYSERSHFNGNENVYLTFRMTEPFLQNFSSFNLKRTKQTGTGKEPIPRPVNHAAGMVAELTLISPGKNYAPNSIPQYYAPGSPVTTEMPITTDNKDEIETDPNEDVLVYETKASNKGQGLTVIIDPERTVDNGITSVTIETPGSGYEVGEIVSIGPSSSGVIANGAEAALFEVTKVKEETPVFEYAPLQVQNNYIVLPDDVTGVLGVMRSVRTDLVGIFPGASVFPLMLGGMLGNDAACGDMGYDLVSYVAMREYMATFEFLFFPPIQYSFNQRTHRLYIDTNNFIRETGAYSAGMRGAYLALNVMMKPSPDVFPDLWNDLWLKEYTTALVKCQWGRNLTKYTNVNLPGGITMNGDQILRDGLEEVKLLKERFAMDWADPVLDMVG